MTPEALPAETPAVIPVSPGTAATSTPQGEGGVTVYINSADFHLDPTDQMNRAFLEQIANLTNRSFSQGLGRLNTYG